MSVNKNGFIISVSLDIFFQLWLKSWWRTLICCLTFFIKLHSLFVLNKWVKKCKHDSGNYNSFMNHQKFCIAVIPVSIGYIVSI